MDRTTPTTAGLKLLTWLLIHGAGHCRTTAPIARRMAQAGWVENIGFDEYRITDSGVEVLSAALPAVTDLWSRFRSMERAYLDIVMRDEGHD